jgi:hypothetical protein
MASETVARVADRMARDEAFRKAVFSDPTKALAGYDLTEEEKRSLLGRSGAPGIGVDRRETKFHL